VIGFGDRGSASAGTWYVAIMGRGLRSVAVVALVACVAAAPAAASPDGGAPQASGAVLAVVPFRDLGPTARGHLGDAVAEALSTDLRALASVRIVERAALTRVVAELDRAAASAASAAEPDPAALARVGHLVGATLIVVGAIQRQPGALRLTARLLRVDTAEVLAAAKVDGLDGDLFSLEDRLAAELARALGHTSPPPPRRRRPAPLRAVERWGDALAARDEAERRAILDEVLALQPDFDDAARGLAEAEQRLARLDATLSREEARRQLVELDHRRAAITAARTPRALVAAWEALFDALHAQLRFGRLCDEVAPLVDRPPSPFARLASAPADADRLHARALFEAVFCAALRKRDGDTIRLGQRLLAEHPAAAGVADARDFVAYALQHERLRRDGPARAAARLAALSPAARANPCRVARILHEERRLDEAVRPAEECAARPDATLVDWVALARLHIARADFRAARETRAQLRARWPAALHAPEAASLAELPIDLD